MERTIVLCVVAVCLITTLASNESRACNPDKFKCACAEWQGVNGTGTFEIKRCYQTWKVKCEHCDETVRYDDSTRWCEKCKEVCMKVWGKPLRSVHGVVYDKIPYYIVIPGDGGVRIRVICN